MNIKQAKEIPLDDFLAWLGYQPTRKAKGELWYKSPFRSDDNTPSFKISASKKAWFDFGDGGSSGGSIIDFCLRYYNLPENAIPEALRELRAYSGRVVANDHEKPIQRAGNRQETVSKTDSLEKNDFKDEEAKSHILNHVKEFEVWQGYGKGRKYSSQAQYLMSRGIDPRLGLAYLVNIGFSPAYNPNKKWFGLGFPNNSGGYEVRAKFGDTDFKTVIGTKDLTFFAAQPLEGEEIPKKMHVFEGWSDFLTYLSMFESVDRKKENYLILNSATLAGRAVEALENHEIKFNPIIIWPQNDTAGRKAAEMFLQLTDRTVLTASHYYEGFNDLNEAHCSKKIKPEEPKAKFNPEYVASLKARPKPQ
jgi:hypothetical protein